MSYPPLDRARIESLIPHQGAMCLLDAVPRWDELALEAVTERHRRADHPLRHEGRIAAVHLIEYGAQAMAIHGRLLELRKGHGPPRPGVLVTARDVKLECAGIEDCEGALTIRAQRLMGNRGGLLYQFEAWAGERLLARGRVGVIHTD